MRVASHVKLLRRAADKDRDRLERQLRVAGRLGGVGLLGLGRLGSVLGRRGSVKLGLRVGLGGVELRLQFLDFRSGLLLLVLASCLGLVVLAAASAFSATASAASARVLANSSLRSAAVSGAASFAARAAAFFVC
jgi:hypothetical protein